MTSNRKPKSPRRSSRARARAGIVRDIAERTRAEIELQRSNRALRAISASNQALIRAQEEPALLNEICRVCVEIGGYRMAWVGFAEHDAPKTVRPVAQKGFEAGYLDTINITWADAERGRGPTGTAIRTGKPSIARNIPGDPHYAPWRAAAIQRGYVSSIALPLISDDIILGALNIYAVEPDAFDTAEAALLKEFAADLAYGIQALRTRAAHAQAEEEIRQRNRELTAISDIISATATNLDLQTILDRALQGALELTGIEGGTLCLIAPEQRALNLAAAINTSPETIADLTKNVIQIGDCLCGKVADTGEPLILWDNASGSEYATRESTRKENIRFHAAFPMQVKGKSIGVLCIFARNDAKPTQRSLDLVRDLCGPVALAIENARLFQAAQNEIAERKRAEAQLAYQANLLANVNDAVIASDARSVTTSWNRAAEEIYGWKAEEMLGRVAQELLRSEFVGIEPAQVRRALAETGEFRGEMIQYRKDGTPINVETNIMALRGADGSLSGFIGVNRDITERKRAEEALRESEERFRLLTELISDFAYALRIEADGKPQGEWLTDAFTREFGFTLEEIDARGGLFGIVYPDDLPIAQDHFGQVMAGQPRVPPNCKPKTRNWKRSPTPSRTT